LDREANVTRSGQQKGGYARKEKLSSARRREIAARAARARWDRESTNVNLEGIEGFQMNADAIDAADILVTELSEQAAALSQAGMNALSNGHLAEARLIIGAIEETQALRDQAEQLKTDIVVLRSALVPTVQPDDETLRTFDSEASENIGRKQDRTDPALMNAKRRYLVD
jgi:hypothetical protein